MQHEVTFAPCHGAVETCCKLTELVSCPAAFLPQRFFGLLAATFLLSSHLFMQQTYLSRVAETILAAPGCGRVGITAPGSHGQVAAAHEFALAILEDTGQPPNDATGD